MNPRVHKRHTNLKALIGYLFREGKDDDHTDGHLIAAWDGAGELTQLEPAHRGSKREVQHLVDLLGQPLHAAHNPPRLTVWHCSIRNAPTDRILPDQEWAEIARQVMHATDLAPLGDSAAVRWIAVRHSPNHIHLAATLVRQDGRTAWGWQDKLKTRRCCDELELRYGLQRSGPSDGTAHRRPSPQELGKTRRKGRTVPARDELRRRVRAAALAATGETEFFALLADAGVLVSKRTSTHDPGEVTGYAVALPTDKTSAGNPVFYGGGKLARDLTLPKLRARWVDPDAAQPRPTRRQRVSQQARAAALSTAAEAIRGAADAMTALADGGNTAAALAVAQAAADTLAAIASTVEGVRGGPVSTAAELFDQAARERNGTVLAATSRSFDLRGLSRAVHLMGRVSGDADTQALLQLMLDLARLAETLARLRTAQERYHQAQAAHTAAATLHAAASTTGRLVRPDTTTRPDPEAQPLTSEPPTRPGAPTVPLSTSDEQTQHHHR